MAERSISMRIDAYKPGLHVCSFTPDDVTEAESPLVVFFPGGGWKSCNSRTHFAQCHVFAKNGIIASSVQYSTPGVKGLSQCMSDAFDALNFVYTLFANRIDEKKICVMGMTVYFLVVLL